ncbi:MAG: AI-2E family transporter [Oscillospiraceae bacterium]|nr:AI-2E family transporter [Oscillospiraceae bacterium]
MMRKSRYMVLGLTVFVTVAAILLFYDTLFGRRVLLSIWSQFLTAIRPIVYGAFMAYLLAPVVNFFERGLTGAPAGKARQPKHFSRAAVRAVSILLTWAVICVLFYLLASVLLPELYKSIVQLVSNVENYYRTISGWVEHLLESNPAVESWVAAQMQEYYEDITNWLKNDLLPRAQIVMVAAAGGVMTLLGFLKNLLVGIIVSVYLLATKERCAAHARKVVYSLFSPENVRWVLRGTRKADGIFSGFVRGKLLDSLIIGILCFIGCSILKFPYTPLVSVIVGVTNIIPFFGPFLGAVPSGFLILLVSPLKALYFLIFVLALQQLDGNFIGPKILGGTTGLSSLWVIIAILVGGSFFGVPGMFFGVPVCACLYSLVDFLVEARLRRRDLPLDTGAYAADLPREERPGPPPEE